MEGVALSHYINHNEGVTLISHEINLLVILKPWTGYQSSAIIEV